MNQEPEAVSSRSLLGAFFAVVVLCAVFFSLGFFLGNRQGHPGSALATEQVPAASDAPPDVNVPESSQPAASDEPRAAGAGSSLSAAPQPAESNASPDQSATTAAAPASTLPSTDAPPARAGDGAKSAPASENGESLESTVAARVPSGVLVQVAAVTNRQDAANVVGVLKSRNYPALILTPAQAKARDSFYRVVAGPYKSRTDAERVRKELTAEGFKPFIR